MSGDPAQHLVAGVVSLQVVYRLEVVKVDVGQREGSAVAGGPGQLGVELGDEGASVQQSSEGVRSGEAGFLPQVSHESDGEPRHHQKQKRNGSDVPEDWTRILRSRQKWYADHGQGGQHGESVGNGGARQPCGQGDRPRVERQKRELRTHHKVQDSQDDDEPDDGPPSSSFWPASQGFPDSILEVPGGT